MLRFWSACSGLSSYELTTLEGSVSVTDTISLVRLTDEEINDRQPYIEHAGFTKSTYDLLDPYTEIRMSLNVPVDPSVEVPILSTQNVASDNANLVFNNILSALRLCKPGLIDLETIWISNLFTSIGMGRIYTLPIWTTQMQVGAPDVKAMYKAYQMVTESQSSSDEVLKRAIHRFTLGRQRYDPVDRLVDYAIALESLLLTSKEGGAIKQEQTYRFAINGANILRLANLERNRRRGHKLMKDTYSIRSVIVHGSSSESIDTEAKKAGFDSIAELGDDIEEKLRRIIFWLTELDVNQRPYNKAGGWESLLWGG